MVSFDTGISGRTTASTDRATTASGRGVPLLAMVFLLSLMIPLIILVGPLRLNPYRLLLLLAVVPLLISWIAGRAGKMRAPDTLMVAFTLWGTLALIWNHGFSQIEFIGIFAAETLGAYFLGRVTVRNARQFRAVIAMIVISVLVLLPLVWFEAFTNRPLLIELFRVLGPTLPNVSMPQRLGLERAQGPFEHSILLGLYCGSAFGLALYALSARGFGAGIAIFAAALIPLAVFPSLSSGAMLAVSFQLGLVLYDRFTRSVPGRWRILFFITLALYIVVDMLSNRTPFTIFIEYFTFNTGSSWNRVLIWEFGTAEVARHPIFGIGLNEWARAHWMSTSLDNYWLLHAVRYGIPGFVFLAGAIGLAMWRVGHARLADPVVAAQRAGWLISLGGIALGICTVHLWGATSVFYLFLVGAGMWMLDAPEAGSADDGSPPAPTTRPARAVLGAAPRARPAL